MTSDLYQSDGIYVTRYVGPERPDGCPRERVQIHNNNSYNRGWGNNYVDMTEAEFDALIDYWNGSTKQQ